MNIKYHLCISYINFEYPFLQIYGFEYHIWWVRMLESSVMCPMYQIMKSLTITQMTSDAGENMINCITHFKPKYTLLHTYIIRILIFCDHIHNYVCTEHNDLTLGWQNLNPLSHLNSTLAPQARQARPSGEILNYSLSR